MNDTAFKQYATSLLKKNINNTCKRLFSNQHLFLIYCSNDAVVQIISHIIMLIALLHSGWIMPIVRSSKTKDMSLLSPPIVFIYLHIYPIIVGNQRHAIYE